MIAAARTATGRNAYAELLRDTRGMKREQQQARDAWFAALSVDRQGRDPLRAGGLAQGARLLRQPAQPPGIALRAADDRIARFSRSSPASARRRARAIVQLVAIPARRARSRLRVPALPRDRAPGRRRAHEAPPIFALGSGDAGGEPDRDAPRAHEPHRGDERPAASCSASTFRLFYAMARDGDARDRRRARSSTRSRRSSSAPSSIASRSAQVLELIQGVTGRAGAPARRAHVPLAVPDAEVPAPPRQSIALDHWPTGASAAAPTSSCRRAAQRTRAPCPNYLRRRSGSAARGELRARPVEGPRARRAIAAALRRAARRGEPPHRDQGRAHRPRANLKLEMRRTFEHDLPPADAGTQRARPARPTPRGHQAASAPRSRTRSCSSASRSAPRSKTGKVFDDQAARRATSERLRRDVWMFAQIVRAFASKARHADPDGRQWSTRCELRVRARVPRVLPGDGLPAAAPGRLPARGRLHGRDEQPGRDRSSSIRTAPRRWPPPSADAFHAILGEAASSRISERDELAASVPFDQGKPPPAPCASTSAPEASWVGSGARSSGRPQERSACRAPRDEAWRQNAKSGPPELRFALRSVERMRAVLVREPALDLEGTGRKGLSGLQRSSTSRGEPMPHRQARRSQQPRTELHRDQ
jgi:hypothetical protein